MRIRSFRNEKRKQYYFRVYNSIEEQVLRSEAYNSKAARDNGIESFKKNAPIDDRYERLTSSDGKYYFNIKAANHQIVATSLMFDSEDAQEAAIKEIIAYASSAGSGDSNISTSSAATSTATNLAASPAPVAKDSDSDASKEQDDYMDASFYQNSGTDTTSGFDKFQKGDNDFYYFSFKSDDGRALLTSQGYTQESGRDNGITSVEKNSKIEKRYTPGKTDDGKFFFTLKAGNHQEIARSIDFDSEDEMKKAMGIVLNGGGTMVETTAKASPKGTDDGGDSKEQDDYMDASFYQNSGTDTTSGFDKFAKGDNNFSYFSFKSDDGKVLLLSQGYTQESGRDNGIASVEKNSKVEKRYTTGKTDSGKFFFTLKAGNHQEIARSADFDSEDEMKRAMTILMNGGGSMVEKVKAAPVTPAPKASGEGMDDYRTFGFYKNSGTDVQSGWDKFYSEKHNEYYFSYKVDGEPVIISEGYTSEAARDNGIASVEKNWGIEKRYKTHETPSGRYYYTLRAGNHQEIARSKWYASADERDGGWKWLMGGGLGAAAAASSMTKSSLVSEETTEAVALEAPTASDKGGEKIIETPAAEPAEKEDDYLPCKEYEGHKINDKVNGVAFFKHENGQFYFVVYKEDGSVRLRSEGFGSAKDRDVELSGMLKNLNNPDMYETITRGKYSMHILKDDMGREVGRSCLEKEVTKVAAPPVKEAPVVETVAATAVAAAAVSASSTEEVKTEKEDDYLPCKEYEGHKINDKVNGVAFFKHENGQFYFVVYKEDGSVRLRSEGFGSAKDRDVELSGMLKNLNNPDMYETITRGKYSMHMLKDDTGREVGRSCLEKEVTKVAAPPVKEAPVVETVAATAVAAAAVSASSTEEVKTEKEDDYLPCKEYEGHEVNDKVNNIAFFKHENGQFYFVVYKEDGSVRLRSEGFGSTKDRDVELSGVIKNLDNADMYETIKRGKYSIHILRDSTGREVGRSCLEKEAAKVVAPPVVEVAAATAVAATVVSAASTKEVKKEKEDDYLPCKEYEGHTVNDKKNKVAFFKHENGQFYFVVYKEDGSVRLRSEGFESAKNRDDELSALLKNIGNKEMYETLTRGKYRIHILRDKNGREVGRSCLETIEVKKAAPPVVEVAAATAVAAAAITTTTKVEKEKEDDYLPCQDYQGHKVTDKKNNVAFFKKDGQFYFVIYKANGDVRLRSEGFKKSKGRDSELSAAIKNLNNADRYETLKRGKYSLHILKDENGREVGRSCLETEDVIIAPPIVETVAATAAAAAIVTETVKPEPEIKVEKEVVAPVVKKKVVAPVAKKKVAAAAAAPVVEKAAAAAATGGGFNWWWLLPLLLIPLLFLLFKGCDGCGGKTTATTAPPPPVEKPVEKVTPPVEKPVEKVTPPPAPTCNCTGSDNVVFNIRSGAAKVLTRLGTNPEFGNSHSLDPAGFYNKLKNAHSSSSRDKQFLDGVFRSMGYSNGFADANAGLFSNARIAPGTVGNIGFSNKHRTVKAKLNTQGKDLEAFKIKAANGCDIHFMKTCGNHFFYCPN